MIVSKEAQKVLESIKTLLEKENKPPTIRKIAEDSGFSTKLVLHYLFELETNGYIRRSPYRSRTIQTVSRDNSIPEKDVSLIPLVGFSAGGSAILAEQNVEDYIPVSTKLIGTAKDSYLLKIKGSSMEPYLEDGDIAIVKVADKAEKGEIIVASIENEVTGDFESTIKEYYPTDSKVILRPINKDNDPILVEKKKLHIQGVVKGVIKYSE